jgi:hypothetical protein
VVRLGSGVEEGARLFPGLQAALPSLQLLNMCYSFLLAVEALYQAILLVEVLEETQLQLQLVRNA